MKPNISEKARYKRFKGTRPKDTKKICVCCGRRTGHSLNMNIGFWQCKECGTIIIKNY